MNFEVGNLQDIVLLSIMCCAATLLLPAPRRWWVRPWLKRKDKGNLHLVNKEFGEDAECLHNFLRMDRERFEDLFMHIKDDIEKRNTFLRQSIPARDKLIVTLRYLATGETMRSLSYSFRLGYSSISEIIPEVCNAICKNLKQEFLEVGE